MTQDNPLPPTPDPTVPADDGRSTAALCHYFNVIWLVPLIIYLTRKDQSAIIKREGAESLNFSLTCLIAHTICAVTACFLVPVFISLALFVVQIVFGIIGGNKVKSGGTYVYPWRIEFIK
ncbi:MAG: DUF4870 domain-containing protein [Burkholderiales bacterium]|nr:DUF4870 domain-containing protein [Phycisphaerae bacterium]